MFNNKNDDSVTLVDFGLSAYGNEACKIFIRCGTPGYIAPEIFSCKDKNQIIDPICDVFSVGCLFY